MTVTMFRARFKDDCVEEAEATIRAMFAAIDEVRPDGVRYASTRLGGGTTFVALLSLDRADNPLADLPEFAVFQGRLAGWFAEPPVVEQLEVVGSYGLF
jgi:hypothetical protein